MTRPLQTIDIRKTFGEAWLKIGRHGVLMRVYGGLICFGGVAV